MQKIVPFLWFDGKAEEAMGFYVSTFAGSKVLDVTRAGAGGPAPEGTVLSATFSLWGREFMALNGGPQFSFTQSVSYFVSCPTVGDADALWAKLSQGAEVMMEFRKYPFSEKYGWLNDRFGVSWQLFVGPGRREITPFLMFVGANAGKAEEAMRFYSSVFKDSSVGMAAHYDKGTGEPETSLVHGEFTLEGLPFMAMDSSLSHASAFSEANSFYVSCKDQEEVDRLWQALSMGGSPGRCGWLKDKFGVSWQIIPDAFGELMRAGDAEQTKRVMQAMLQMGKMDVQALKKAFGQR